MHLFKKATITCCFLIGAHLSPANPLPDLGDYATGSISKSEAQQMGNEILAKLKKHIPVVDDPLWQFYIEQLGKNLISYSQAHSTKINFILLETDTINAFALPGNIVGIHSGLVLESRYEGELASVLAHEIAHITQKHFQRMMEKQKHTLISQIGGILAAAALSAVDARAADAALKSTLAAGHQSMIGYTRDHEYEADWLGVQTLTKANYPESDMANFFSRLPKNTYHADYGALYTHPYPTKRASSALNRMSDHPTQTSHSNIISDIEYQLMKIRLRILTSGNKQLLLRNITSQFEDKPDDLSLQYGQLYLNLLLQNSTELNLENLQTLYQRHTHSITLSFTLIDMLIQYKHFDKADALLQAASIRHLDSLPFAILQVELLQAQKHYQQAKSQLLDIIQDHPKYILAYRQLANTYIDLNKPGLAHFYMAKYHHHTGEHYLAEIQLELALEHLQKNTYYRSQIKQLMLQWSS